MLLAGKFKNSWSRPLAKAISSNLKHSSSKTKDNIYTTTLESVGSKVQPTLAYRILDNHGIVLDANQEPKFKAEELKKMYTDMLTISIMDNILYDAQRQGRISFYLTNHGEEACQIGSAAALSNDDHVFAQYREAGVFKWRGYTLAQFMNQCYGNKEDQGKGKMMPVHYGDQRLNLQTISSPLGTQISHAAGAAYALKMKKSDNIVICYFGDGAASEGDFHAGLNFAATTEAPVVFLCRNNGYAISTPTREQYRGDGIASRGLGYGMTTFKVDGNDLLAVYNVTKRAREIAVNSKIPVLIEAITYRIGHHSTSDDSTAYRPKEEIDEWTSLNNPTTRFKQYIMQKGVLTEQEDETLYQELRKEVLAEFGKAEKLKKPKYNQMFEDVYDEMTWNIKAQQDELNKLVERYPQDFPLDQFEDK